MNEIQKDTTSDIKIYKDKAIYGASYIGGPLAAGYIISENFKAFGDKEKVKKTWIITIVFIITLFSLILFTPGFERIPRFLIPLSYTLIAYWLIRQYQGKQIDEHINKGGKTYSGWRVALISIISLAITFVSVLPFILLIPDEKAETQIYSYKGIQNEITYYPNNIGKDEIVSLCQKLEAVNHFDSTYAMSLFFDKEGKNYKIYIPYSTSSWDNPGDVGFYENVRRHINSYYPKNSVEIILCDSAYNPKRTIK